MDEFDDDFDVPLPEEPPPIPTKLTPTHVMGGIRLEFMFHGAFPAVRVLDSFSGEVALFTDPVTNPKDIENAVLRFNDEAAREEKYMMAVEMFPPLTRD
jgi:hypothetical protein